MFEQLQMMTSVPTMLGRTVTVKRRIGGGGQGDVYEVLYEGERKALKWYAADSFKNPKAFVRNLKRNIETGAPTEAFLWPLDLTDFHDGGFGYVMDLRPSGYYEVNDFLLNHVAFPSYRRAVDACLGIVSAFRMLHNAGYAYQDINSKNFFIQPETGKVLICDNDNVVPDGTDTGMKGTWGFMAPEIVRGGFPTELSDRHSMAVLIFLLLFKVHPLEGKATADTVFSERERARVYGEEPLFVFDATSEANALSPDVYGVTIAAWQEMPSYLRDLFMRAFSQESLRDGRDRPIDAEWMAALARLRSEIQPCPCGESEVIVESGKPAVCEACGRSLAPRLLLDLGPRVGYCLPAAFDTRIYSCQVRVTKPAHALDVVGWVLRSAEDRDVVGLRNMSDDSWFALDAQGNKAVVASGEVLPLREGVEISDAKYLRLRCRANGEEASS